MTVASIATVAISLLILGCAWLLVLNSQHLAGTMESELEINAYINKNVTREDALNLRREIEAVQGVEEVAFVSKEEGLSSIQEKLGEDADIVGTVGNANPLPDMYRVKAKAADQVPQIAESLDGIIEVEKVRYGQGMVEKLLALTRWLRTVGIIIVVAIGLAAVFLISTTIRITVYSRRREIGIMKLVGATNWYIQGPFFLEGVMTGFLGASLAVIVLHICYSGIVNNVMLTLNFLPVLKDTNIIYTVYKSLLVMGTTLGALGSTISLKRFLKGS